MFLSHFQNVLTTPFKERIWYVKTLCSLVATGFHNYDEDDGRFSWSNGWLWISRWFWIWWSWSGSGSRPRSGTRSGYAWTSSATTANVRFVCTLMFPIALIKCNSDYCISMEFYISYFSLVAFPMPHQYLNAWLFNMCKAVASLSFLQVIGHQSIPLPVFISLTVSWRICSISEP